MRVRIDWRQQLIRGGESPCQQPACALPKQCSWWVRGGSSRGHSQQCRVVGVFRRIMCRCWVEWHSAHHPLLHVGLCEPAQGAAAAEAQMLWVTGGQSLYATVSGSHRLDSWARYVLPFDSSSNGSRVRSLPPCSALGCWPHNCQPVNTVVKYAPGVRWLPSWPAHR